MSSEWSKKNIHIIVLVHSATNFMRYTSPSGSKTSPQHDAATPVPHGWGGVLWVPGLTLLPPYIMLIINILFLSHLTREHSFNIFVTVLICKLESCFLKLVLESRLKQPIRLMIQHSLYCECRYFRSSYLQQFDQFLDCCPWMHIKVS